MELNIARIDRAQGLRGEVALTLFTDDPDSRLAVGTQLETDRDDAGSLTIASTRIYKSRWYVRFEEVPDRTAAEALQGTILTADIEGSDEEDAWYAHELTGLHVELADGTVVGTVIGLEHLPAQDLLVVAERPGGRTLIPMVYEILLDVDIAGRRIVVDPPGGLLERDQIEGQEDDAL
ncbi:ribosome maturation factor RimM [Rarobacter faecitabidus]|uniref:Ribosome maturation factor RimM n=1 Tax=Rarobacter faecitabidus TaxID=13243 RepID=A0A542ZWG8_RARFA|nr:ribosome maturation factor RimM [Rarobacter faecitabidus]TQL64705.1 16S rRNA processing protein RimM [Rarobacter faecitabidus]